MSGSMYYTMGPLLINIYFGIIIHDDADTTLFRKFVDIKIDWDTLAEIFFPINTVFRNLFIGDNSKKTLNRESEQILPQKTGIIHTAR